MLRSALPHAFGFGELPERIFLRCDAPFRHRCFANSRTLGQAPARALRRAGCPRPCRRVRALRIVKDLAYQDARLRESSSSGRSVWALRTISPSPSHPSATAPIWSDQGLIAQTMRMFALRLQSHQIHHVDDANFELGKCHRSMLTAASVSRVGTTGDQQLRVVECGAVRMRQ
jgi:hypothetical protein